jgi:hypothetical protein
MRTRSLLIALAAPLFAVPASAQGLPQFPQEEVLVIVWKSAGRCSVLDRKTTCARIPGLMTGVLQVGRDRHIVVAAEGEDSEVQTRAAQLMSDIRAAGYRNVRPALPGR